MRSGYLARSFDLLNVRDLDLVAQARAHCDWLTLAVLSDEAVAGTLGRAPVVPFVERFELVRHLRGVDEVVVHQAENFAQSAHNLTVFTVAGEVPVVDHTGEAVVMLTPRRASASWMLLAALQADTEWQVA